MNIADYYDLTADELDIDTLTIHQIDSFNCSLKDTYTGSIYKGLILAKSPSGNRFTVCDIDFQRSAIDEKYQPRLTFRRTFKNLDDVEPLSTSDHVRLSFAAGMDGYRNFWKMIFFLYKFKEQVDFGNFENEFQVITREQFQAYLNDQDNIEAIKSALPDLNIEASNIIKTASTLRALKSCKDKLESFIEDNSSETDVQNWIDEDEDSHRRERCMIFGLEYIDFKREGSASRKRFDILTRVGLKNIERVLIELKGPCDDVFNVSTEPSANGSSQEYALHTKLARAIPQILEYKSILESKPPGDPDLVALGINEKIKINKCIIVIGKNSSDTRWIQNKVNLAGSLNSSLEVWTYTDLLNKIDTTIQNIESS